MNANEVIANRALEILGHERGQYEHLHPNNHVNLGQSTNDVYPTAIRLTMMLSFPGLTEAMDRLIETLRAKGEEFSHLLKMGDRKSTRLNSSHVAISYAVFCLKKKRQ